MRIHALDYPIKYVWLFLTDKCTLNCDYCFFKYRFKQRTLSFAAIKTLLQALPRTRRLEFVLSGGEPLGEWSLVKKTIGLIRDKFPASSIVLQSNMLFLNSGKIPFLKQHGVIVEPGIDGSFLSNFRHRRGISAPIFRKIAASIGRSLKNDIEVVPTLTVHPKETSKLLSNFKFLHSLGIKRADVHPAFLESWRPEDVKVFKKMYKLTVAASKKYHLRICDCYNEPIPFSFDLIVQPDGNILPNWVYLAFPEKIRRDFFILSLGERNISTYVKNLKRILNAYRIFFLKHDATYRELSNFNAKMALTRASNKDANACFGNYEKICAYIRTTDSAYLNNSFLR